jgi:hypothetical protein
MMAGSGGPYRRSLPPPARWRIGPLATARCLLLVLLVAAAGARAALFVPEPTSRLYETVAVAAGGGISVAEDATVSGNLVCNDDVDLQERSRVTGDVAAAGRVHNHGTVGGRVVERAPPVTLPVLPTVAQARAVANRVFNDDKTFTDAVIDDVVFVAGDVHVRGSLNGKGTLIVRGDVELAAVGHQDRDPPVRLDAATRMSLVALGSVQLGAARSFRGVVVAGHGLELDSKARFEGVLVARGKIQIGGGATVSFARVDQTPPTFSALAPPAGSLLGKASPVVSAALADDLSGVDPATFKLLVDGNDRTGAAQVTGSGFSFTPQAPLADGLHTVAVSVQDRGGNLAQAQWSFTTDVTPPTLAFSSPSGQVTAGSQVQIGVAYGDATSRVDLASLRVSLDGVDLTGSCTVAASSASCSAPPPALGSHGLAASVRDRAGNATAASLGFQVVTAAPAVSITSPADPSYSQAAAIQVTGTINSVVTAVTIGGRAAALGPGSFTAAVILREGVNVLLAVAMDASGNVATAAATVTLDTRPPAVTLTTPASGLITNQPQVQVAGTAVDDTGVARLTVAGQPVALVDGRFSTSVPVSEGANSIAVEAVDLAGNQQRLVVTVNRFAVPTVAITSPPDLSYVAATTLTVSGTVDAAVSVNVNGVAATLSGTTFAAAGVPLVEGGNSLTATATDGRGHIGLATINVVRDLTPPHVAIYTPADGATVAETSVLVAGLVNDIVAGSVNAGDARVSVNGVPAAVANRSFVAVGVPLRPGANVLTAAATDASGNQGQASITVRQAAPAGPRVVALSGNAQQAVIGRALAQPLAAVLLDATGSPVGGRTVLFRVRGGDGTLDGGRRAVAVVSDATGQALAHFAAGTRAGAGNQVVEASAVGFGPAAVFVASALPGAPARLVVDAGDQQLGVAGQALPRPLVATVVDAGSNRLAGIAGSFSVVKGAGHFANGQQSLSLSSDSDGRFIASFVTDPTEGVAGNVVAARLDALPAGPAAIFTASTWAAGDPALTAVSGVVLDNSNLPVAGVTVRVRDTVLTAATDAQGLFHIAPAPVGTLKLIVDGSTAQRPGAWPDLEFDLTTVPGRDNTLRMPIYLLPLDLANGLQVDETHGGKLVLQQLPGFALDILPGSVTFPGGGRSGFVSVTVVHSDKVPMVPNFGQQPRLIVTIQPAGARFDPPARLTLPNVEGLAPGQVAELYSFDHDLGHFVSIGPGTVSDDGMVVISNVGVGILKAAWHCCGFPQVMGTTDDCPECKDCLLGRCVPKELCAFCSEIGAACDGDGSCASGAQLLPKLCAKKQLTTSVTQAPSFTCKKCGVGVWRTYDRVDPHCQSVSLTGTTLHEDVTPQETPGIPACSSSPTLLSGLDCPLKGTMPTDPLTGGPCNDHVQICGKDSDFPMGTCAERVKQVISVDGCEVETHIFTFIITRTATSCSGELQQQ